MKFYLYCLLILFSQPLLALDATLSLKLGDADLKLSQIEKQLNSNTHHELASLEKFHSDSLNIQALANQCVNSNEIEINASADDLELLGAQGLVESKDVTEKRVSLNKNMLSSAQQLASCRLMLLRAKETISSSADRQQKEIENKLFTQRGTLLDHLQFNLENPLLLLSEQKEVFYAAYKSHTFQAVHYTLIGIFILAIAFSIVIKKGLKQRLNKNQFQEPLSLGGQIKLSLMSCTQHYLPLLLSTASMTAYLFASQNYTDNKFLSIFIVGLFLLSLMIWLNRVFFNPCSPAQSFLVVEQPISVLLSKRLRFLSWILFVGFLLFFTFENYHFNEYTQGLVRNIFLAFVVLNLIWITLILGEFTALANTLLIRFILVLVLIGSLLSDWFGYSNLAFFALLGLSGSVFLLIIALFISRLFSDFIDGFDEGRYQWQKNARKMIGVKTDEYIPGAIWLRFSGNILIWALCFALALKVWGLPDSLFLQLQDVVVNGFTLGSIQLIPTRILISLLTFSLMISMIGWIKRRLDKSWLKRSRMDRGSKEAMISLTGYFGMAVAIVVTLSIAGVQLANLAIVAGALSVGIGFGLQNIVNNFVSGVILLFERPIKTGDWVSVGGTEGYVRKISIRSTQIQTFDRSDVLVPNSELISGQVTNWMLKDSRGRLIVPVGVAYGSDAEKVKAILLSIAEAHDQVIQNSPILSNPYVLFREFGDSSLNLELRCFLINVDSRLRVLSDINFEINRLFLQHNIEIPFPQRDLNIKSMPNLSGKPDNEEHYAPTT